MAQTAGASLRYRHSKVTGWVLDAVGDGTLLKEAPPRWC